MKGVDRASMESVISDVQHSHGEWMAVTGIGIASVEVYVGGDPKKRVGDLDGVRRRIWLGWHPNSSKLAKRLDAGLEKACQDVREQRRVV